MAAPSRWVGGLQPRISKTARSQICRIMLQHNQSPFRASRLLHGTFHAPVSRPGTSMTIMGCTPEDLRLILTSTTHCTGQLSPYRTVKQRIIPASLEAVGMRSIFGARPLSTQLCHSSLAERVVVHAPSWVTFGPSYTSTTRSFSSICPLQVTMCS